MAARGHVVDKKVKVQVYIPKMYYNQIEKDCASKSMNPSEVIRDIVRSHYAASLGDV